jgi:hypothetical protein
LSIAKFLFEREKPQAMRPPSLLAQLCVNVTPKVIEITVREPRSSYPD